MLFDSCCYADGELNGKSYAKYYIWLENANYLSVNYPKVNYTINTTNNYYMTDDGGEEE